MRRRVAAAVLVLLGIAMLGGAAMIRTNRAESLSDSSEATCETALRHDFGIIHVGSRPLPLQTSFSLSLPPGIRPDELSVIQSCGCVSATPVVVDPAERSLRIEIELLASRPGPLFEQIWIQCHDHVLATLQLAADVRQSIRLVPAVRRMGEGRARVVLLAYCPACSIDGAAPLEPMVPEGLQVEAVDAWSAIGGTNAFAQHWVRTYRVVELFDGALNAEWEATGSEAFSRNPRK